MLHNVQILTVDNDLDSGELYTALLERCGITVMATESIKAALNFLDQFVPDILICEGRFLDESVDPSIQKVRIIAQNSCKVIPVFVISNIPAIDIAKHLKVKIEAYQIKPIDLGQLVDEVWGLILRSRTSQPFSFKDCLTTADVGKTPYCCAGAG